MSILAILLAMLLAGSGNFTMHHNEVFGGGPTPKAASYSAESSGGTKPAT